MNWTTEKPTGPGWYHLKGYRYEIVEIIRKGPESYRDGGLYIRHGDCLASLDQFGRCKWYGPIEQPEED